MAHVIQENNYNVGSTNNNENTSNNNEKDAINVRSLRDVNNFLQQPLKPALNLQADAASYDHIVDMIRGLDIQDDGIEMNRKIKSIEIDFCNIVHDEHILCESMEYMNDKALGDADSALKFAMLFSSHSFDALAMHEMKVRSAMLKILETNYINATIYRTQDKNRLYNSITMLGEYYHRVRLADNMPVSILGESLLRLLNNELKEAQPVELGLAKLLLSQITLNGRLLRSRCEAQLSELFYHLRRQLIEQTSLTCTVKALLLMTLDMYYSDFNNLSTDLEDMYTKYFLQGEQEEDNAQKPTANPPTVNPTVKEAPTPKTNGLDQRVVDEPSSPPIMTSTKKWSEQITEDSYENEFDTWSSLNNNNNNNNNLITAKVDEPQEVSRPAFKKSSPKKLQHQQPQQQANNEDDHNKPMPRWRAPRFNRETSDNRTVQHHQKNDGYVHNKHRSGNRRLSGNFDDDQQSVRSEGGSIRLYSINDRLKHSQEKIDRINPTVGGGGSGGNHNYYNSSSIANSNWDRQSSYNRDDRSERSYISNYERGSHGQQNQQQHRRNGNGSRHFNNNNHHHHNNNKQTYDKPPRFLKQQQQQQQKPTESSGDTSTWRKNWKQRDNGESDDFDNQSRSSSRARTLPRPHKSPLDDQPPVTTATFQQRRNSQSPSGRGPFAANSRQHNYRNNYNHHNNSNYHNRRQYGSQNSLASDASAGGGFIDRRQQHHRRSRQFNHHHDNNVDIKNNNNKNSNNGVNDGVKGDKDWHESNNNGSGPQSLADVDGELVRNARKTANYMNYLSQQK